MAEISHEQFWPELRRRELLGPASPLRLDAGNRDRRADAARALYRITLPDGRAAKLTVAPDLSTLCAQAHDWRRACPALASAALFRLQLEGLDFFAEEFFEGQSLAHTLRHRSLPAAKIHRAFVSVLAALHNTRRPSTDEARREEWESWSREILALPVWRPSDDAFLTQQLLPAVAASLLRSPAQLQRVHGDLTDTNFLLSAAGTPRLIDPEFTRETHFFGSELARFHALSSVASLHPGLFAAIDEARDAATEIYFWLLQIQREVACNEPAYIAQWLAHRLGQIRHWWAVLSPAPEAHCPWPERTDSGSRFDETAQLFWSRDSFWRESDSIRLAYSRGRSQLCFFPISDRAAPWRFDPASSAAVTTITRLAVHSIDHETIGEFSGRGLHAISRLALADTALVSVAAGLQVSSASGDPQLVFNLPSPVQRGGAWLEVEFETAPLGAAALSAPAAPLFQIEVARWTGEAASAAIRISGWVLSADTSPLASIDAVVSDRVVATAGPLPRPDVQQAFPERTHSLHAGFTLALPFVPPTEFIVLVARSTDGAATPFHHLPAGELPGRGPCLGDYAAWSRTYDPAPAAGRMSGSSGPLFSVLLPVFNTPENFLRACIESVRTQYHLGWELCLIDDGSTAQWIAPLLTELARTDPRIRFHQRERNGGISAATNDALQMATGDFVVMLDHDDLLRPHALAELAHALAVDPTLDAVYSDEDKISADGEPVVPFLKPAYSPEFLLGVMYVGHVLCVRTTVARAAGGFDSAFNGVQDYEFFLRVTERTSRIGHVPRILYRWRQSPASSALHGNVKGDMDALQAAAVDAHLRRVGDTRRAVPLGGHRVRLRAEASHPAALLLAWPPDAIIDALACAQLRATGATMYALATTRLPPAMVDAVRRLPVADLGTALGELATKETAGVLITFTAPPIDLSADWFADLTSLAARPDSALVAPVLISLEGLVFESGWTINSAGPRPLMRGFDATGDGYNGSLRCSREVSVVSPLCFAVRRAIFTDIPFSAKTQDWFDECRKLRDHGLHYRVCAPARLRVPLSWRTPASLSAPAAGPDPFFNLHFDPDKADYTLSATAIGVPAPLRWHLDLAPPAVASDGCIEVRGWCFRLPGQALLVELAVGDIRWSARCDQPRPDVATEFPALAAHGCGFSLRLRVPSGRHPISLEVIEGPQRTPLWHSSVQVPPLAGLCRVFAQPPARRVAFQLLAGPSQAPGPIQPEHFPPRSTPAAAPKFTIVTPSFQQAPFLEETLRSVLDQPGVRVDYIVQDGGSTDGSPALIARHAARLFAHASARDDGQADAIRRGFSKSDGSPTDLMAWLNSDDFYLPGALAFVADFFARRPDVDVLYGNRIVVDASSREIGRWLLPPHDPLVLRLNDFVPQETLFWRRRAWEAVGGLDPQLKFAMDWDLLLRFDRAGVRIVHTPHFLGCFRVHPAQKTSAAMHSIGQHEIDVLRQRTFGRTVSPTEIEKHPRLQQYLRRSAWLEWRWRRFHRSVQ